MNKSCEVCNLCKGRYCSNKISIFSILTEEHLGEITSGIYRKSYNKGDVIFQEGDVADKLYLINRGKIKIYNYTKDGNEQILYILTEGDFTGDSNLFNKGQHKFSAEALDETNICILTKSAFDEIIKKNPEIALQIMQLVYEKVTTLEDSVQRLGNKDIESRLAGLLISFIKDFGQPTDKRVFLDIPLSREDMANQIGSSRETVSRKLQSLQSDGIITLDGNKRIIIEDLKKLEEII